MGGARSLADFENLKNFVEHPWKFRAAISVQCVERPFEGADEMPPVSLVIFDFDATLSLYTFMPDDVTCAEQIGAKLSPDDAKRYVQLNFDPRLLKEIVSQNCGSFCELWNLMAKRRGPW